MKILIACEYSGAVRRAFRALGVDAWSCDLLPAEDDSPFHIQGDVLTVLHDGWRAMVGFPPCTDLCVSGARWFPEKRADGRQQRSIAFFMALANAPIEHVAIENPIGIMSTEWRKPDQVIQPWQYGHGETKATCLWLKNLPPLQPTHRKDDMFAEPEPDGREQRIWKLPPSADRWKERSRTFSGIANAMAAQWTEHFSRRLKRAG